MKNSLTFLKLFFYYILLNKSQRFLAKKFKVSRGALRFHLDKYGICKSKWAVKQLLKHTFFQKGHQINLGRERQDMIGNKWGAKIWKKLKNRNKQWIS